MYNKLIVSYFTGNREIRLTLPRFKMEFEEEMIPFFQQLGVTDLFNSRANLKDIAENDDLYVDDVKHKAVIEVNEEGSEAAAVTLVGLVTKSAGPTPIRMKFDRPFYFIIQDKLHNINLFMGRVVDPSGTYSL